MINDNQLTVSYELLYLMQWLMDNESDTLKNLVSKALDSGLKEELEAAEQSKDLQSIDDIQYSIIDFLSLFETLLHEVTQAKKLKKLMEKNLMPAIDHIDNTECDLQTVQSSIEKTSSLLDSNPKKNPQEILFKELLKSWKPSKEKMSN